MQETEDSNDSATETVSPDPYLWRYREQDDFGDIDTLLLSHEGEPIPEKKAGLGETTIVWWDE